MEIRWSQEPQILAADDNQAAPVELCEATAHRLDCNSEVARDIAAAKAQAEVGAVQPAALQSGRHVEQKLSHAGQRLLFQYGGDQLVCCRYGGGQQSHEFVGDFRNLAGECLERGPGNLTVAAGGGRDQLAWGAPGREAAEAHRLTRQAELHERLDAVAFCKDILDAAAAQRIKRRASLPRNVQRLPAL